MLLNQVGNKSFLLPYTELLLCKNSHFVKYMYNVFHVRKQLLDFLCFFVLRF